jgi:hypothetical protein
MVFEKNSLVRFEWMTDFQANKIKNFEKDIYHKTAQTSQ